MRRVSNRAMGADLGTGAEMRSQLRNGMDPEGADLYTGEQPISAGMPTANAAGTVAAGTVAVELVGTAKGKSWRLNAGERLRVKREERHANMSLREILMDRGMEHDSKRERAVMIGEWGARDLDDAMMRWY